MTGQWPKGPDSPADYLAGIGRIFARYPLQVVEDCINDMPAEPDQKWLPAPNQVIAWCDRRLRYYETLSTWSGRVPAIEYAPAKVERDPAVYQGLRSLGDWLRGIGRAVGVTDRIDQTRRDYLAGKRAEILASKPEAAE